MTASPTIEISEARREFGHLQDRVRNERVIYVTKRGKDAFAVVDIEYLQALMETIEIVSDPEGYKLFMSSLEDIKHGRVTDHADVKAEMLRD